VKENGEYVAMLDVNQPPYVEHFGERSRLTAFGCP
jgi:hypothetical protein